MGAKLTLGVLLSMGHPSNVRADPENALVDPRNAEADPMGFTLSFFFGQTVIFLLTDIFGALKNGRLQHPVRPH